MSVNIKLNTEGEVWDAVDAKYTKPTTGIPKTDLDSSVQTSLGKADTALQADDVAEAVDAWCDENITNPDSPPLDRSLSSSSAAAPADMVGDLLSKISVLTKYQSSSFSSGTASVASKRLLLNYDKAIPANMFIGDLYMVANDSSISTTLKVELAKLNSNGSYTVYDSISTTVSISATAGSLVKVYSVNKATQYDTYVFVTFGTASRFRLASITGKHFVVGDDISSTTFTTRNVDNYEMDYLLYCGVTSDYIEEVNENFAQLNDATVNISGQLSDLRSTSNVLTKFQSSSFGTGTSNAASKRLLLNCEKAIPANIFVGDLFMVTHVADVSTTVKIEFTKKNEDGSYTVYDSISTTVSISATAESLVKVCSINKTTQYDTYIFMTFGTASRFELASITGKYFVVGDDISSTTFTTRNVNNYEMNYLLYCGVTSDYITNTNEDFKYLYDAVGDYSYHEFANASQSSGFWNCYIYKNIPTGTKVRVTMLTNTADVSFNVRAYDASDNNQLIKGVFKDVGGTADAKLTLNAVHIRIQASISTQITNAKLAVVITTDTQPGIVSDLFDSSVPKVYHVEKDGSGDFTNLADALEIATQWMDSVVYIGAGTWNILDELGATRLASLSSSYGGIVLKNRVHVICSSKAYIKCLYTGDDANLINYLSAFNSGPFGFTLENADIEVANIRYCVHDERNAETDHYDNNYINCRMKNTNQTPGSRSQCIGGGLGYDGHVIIDGCTFENPLRDNYGIVSYHNAHGLATDSRSLIEVKGCYFYGTNTFRAGYYGNSIVVTQCLVHGNSMGAEPYVAQEDPNYSNVNMEIIKWNNEIRTT